MTQECGAGCPRMNDVLSRDAMPAHVAPPESLASLHPVFVGLAGPE